MAVRVAGPSGTYDVREVFTPTTPARLTFVERIDINTKLVSALSTPGKQIVVYGASGSGKTTLLENKLYQIYENHITTRCIYGLTFDQLVLDAFDQLGVYYISEKTKGKEKSISGDLKADYLSISSKIGLSIRSSESDKESRIIPPQLTPQTLGRFLGMAKCAWILEDFHKIDANERIKLAQVMKVFMDMADIYRDLKIIALGAVDTARLIVESDSEMKNRVSEICVPLMNDDEIRSIIDKGSSLLNFHIKNAVKKSISKYSNGLASVCHQICLNICFASDIYSTQISPRGISAKHMQEALKMYLDEASDTIKASFDKAFRNKRTRKFDNTKLILSALARCGRDGAAFAEIYSEIKKEESSYPSGNLTIYIEELCGTDRGSVIRHDANSGRYSFADPIYRVYALSYFSNPMIDMDDDVIDGVDVDSNMSSILDELIRMHIKTKGQLGDGFSA